MAKAYLVVKKVSTAPSVGEPNTLYLLLDGAKLRIYCSNTDGTIVSRLMDETDTNSLINTILLLLSGQPDGLATLDADSKVEQTAIASDKWASAITLLLKGDVGGSVTFDGSGSVEMFVSKPHSPVMTYLDGRLVRVDYHDSSFKTLSYTGDDVTTIAKIQGDRVFVTSVNYDSEGNVVSAPQTEITADNALANLSSDIDFTTGFPSELSFARGSVQERTNAAGFKEMMGIDTPCLDYTLMGESLGLLIEPPETNLLRYSDQFGFWVKSATTVTGSAALGPDNTMSATKIDETAVNGSHSVRSLSFPVMQGNTYTMVVRLKEDDRNYFKTELGAVFSDFNDNYVIGNLQGDIVLSQKATVRHSLYPDANGFHTTSITASAIRDSTSAFITLYVRGPGSTLSYLGELGKGLFITNAMVLENALTETGHIPTSDSVASRAIQNVVLMGDNFVDTVGSRGTVLIEGVSKIIPDGSNQVLLSMDDGTTLNSVQLVRTSQTSASLRVETPTFTSDTAVTIGDSLTSKMVLVWSPFYFQLWCNGQLVHTETNAMLPLSRLRIAGGGMDGIAFIGHVKKFQVWKDIMLTSTIAQSLSS